MSDEPLTYTLSKEEYQYFRACEIDARRYRYLRDECLYSNGYDTGLEMCSGIECHAAPNKADIDAAIDAAMPNYVLGDK